MSVALPGDQMKEHIVKWIQDYFLQNGPDSMAVIGISGGKDSSVVAALCVEALGKDRVLGVKMPQGTQHDIDYANKLIEHLGIGHVEINIGSTVEALYSAIDIGYDYDHCCKNNPVVSSNTPARIRMATLYAISALVGGRVANTCNRSEDYIGYSTKYGDSAGDFSPLANYTVEEVLLIGEACDLPDYLVEKVPEDGLSGKTDEDNLGFSYKELDNYILRGIRPEYSKFVKINQLHERNKHKVRQMPKCPLHFSSAPGRDRELPF